MSLIQALAGRPEGPPHLRITVIDDPTLAMDRGYGQHIVGQRLSKLAEDFKVPFEFQAAAVSACDVEVLDLGIRQGEAVAVNLAFVLHHVPDESVSTQNHRDRLLRLVKSISPKVVTFAEQESDTNTAAFYPRFIETLDYYTAMFESMDVALLRDNKERINLEQHCYARNLVNILACEGVERVERHELLEKWRSRFATAGFTPYPFSSMLGDEIKKLVRKYSDSFRVQEKDGALYLGWKDKDLVVSCAWKCDS
ncbi:hypothetical protein RJT34_10675 [Clitoria ternatea]|uniref:Uncharacterized protein n=1 Tax=Clitoria ternatea TaxID=43366 RepID=A0AAN9JIM6_CLITE